MLDRQPTLEDISSEYQQIVELIGMDGFLRLVEQFGGYQLYIPKYEGLLRNARNEEIREAFTGYNIDDLARKYNLTTRYIRYIVAPILRKVQARPIDGQIGFLDTSLLDDSRRDTMSAEHPLAETASEISC
jgi:hypothetical protein